jgi:UPF0176 protein
MQISVLLYYKYVHLADPTAIMADQRALCERLGLKGRIILAEEGINGTVAGPNDAIDAYIIAMRDKELFSDIEYKRDLTSDNPFPRLRIKIRPEIVTLGVSVDVSQTAPKISAEEFDRLASDPNVILFDARNDYESAIGRFKGAITPSIGLFKDLPEALNQYDELKNKTIVTYCTGGIRCEKASALMRERGFTDVYQLDGGIIKYAQKYPQGKFEGSCFVFDGRMSVAYDSDAPAISVCRYCELPTSRYQNCANPNCHDLILICATCALSKQVCSNRCNEVIANPVS